LPSDITYAITVDPAADFITFDPLTRVLSYESDNNDDVGVYTVTVTGTV